MKILGLGAGGYDPSTRFRIRQHLQLFKDKGISADELEFKIPKFGFNPGVISKISDFLHLNPLYIWDGLRLMEQSKLLIRYFQYDLIFLNRVLLPCHYTSERFLKNKLVFDFDDAIWMYEAKGFLHKVIKNSKVVFAGNNYLAAYALEYNPNVYVIPTPVDTTKYIPSPASSDNLFVIGWIGTSANYDALQSIIHTVYSFLDRHQNVVFKIMSNLPSQDFGIYHSKIEFTKWSYDKEIDFLQSLSVGIMPLIDGEWTKGKCSYKMLQYMSCAKPVIVSPYGMNKEILDKSFVGFGAISSSEWLTSIETFYGDPLLAIEAGKNGREIIIKEYDLNFINEKIIRIFKSIL